MDEGRHGASVENKKAFFAELPQGVQHRNVIDDLPEHGLVDGVGGDDVDLAAEEPGGELAPVFRRTIGHSFGCRGLKSITNWSAPIIPLIPKKVTKPSKGMQEEGYNNNGPANA